MEGQNMSKYVKLSEDENLFTAIHGTCRFLYVSLMLMGVDYLLLLLKVFFTLYILLVVLQFAGGFSI